MKTRSKHWGVQSILLLLGIIMMPFFLSSCEDSRVQTITWVEYEPVYMTNEEFKNAVSLEAGKDLVNPGKIYFYEGYLFVNELNKGVHVIDNRDPSSPVNTGFINIPANKDIAVRGNLLYADSHSDLLVFDITNLEHADLVHRVEDVFNTSANMAPGFTTQQVDHSQGVVVDWEPVVREEVCEGNCNSHPAAGWRTTMDVAAFSAGSGGSESGGTGGTGGSMARFAITGDFLYAVDHNNLITFSIASESPATVSKKSVGWAIETIFPYRENLFIGSESAMYIYDISSPSAPSQLSVYWHATACDPVVVEGDYAFVTLREGELCPRGVNRLEVVDVEDLTRPSKVKFYEMINPHGLGIDNGMLFVSEGKHGLKVLDASDPYNVKELRHIKDIETYDVIPMDGVLMITGDSGIIQYDYSDIDNLELLSVIPVFHDE
jgi:hypothetical protein